MLAVILVLVVGTIRLVGSNANNVCFSVAVRCSNSPNRYMRSIQFLPRRSARRSTHYRRSFSPLASPVVGQEEATGHAGGHPRGTVRRGPRVVPSSDRAPFAVVHQSRAKELGTPKCWLRPLPNNNSKTPITEFTSKHRVPSGIFGVCTGSHLRFSHSSP
jgi:hypothetical protein